MRRMIVRKNIQNHKVLASRYRSMAHAVLAKKNVKDEANNEVYDSLMDMAIAHEHSLTVLGKKRGTTFIMM